MLTPPSPSAPRRSVAAAGLLLVCGSVSAQAPPLGGTLRDEAGQTLVGGTVQALPGGTGTTVDLDGAWALPAEGVDSVRFAYVGYAPATYAVADLPPGGAVALAPRSLGVVTVTARQRGTTTSTLDPRHVESISRDELERAPCCNLGESFETNAAVDVSYPDPATGAREIQVLGLRGVYSQLLVEKRPTLYGLASTQALDYVPGTWLDGIQIGKGAASVQTGANALSGQVNTELVKPNDAEPLFVNLFASGVGRLEANAHANQRWSDRHATGLLLHGSYNEPNHDRDGDGFYDMPGRQTYTGLLRHLYRSEHWMAQDNLWATRDRREAGQTEHAAGEGDHGAHHGRRPYRIEQANDRLEAFAKTGYLGFARHATSAGLIAGATRHGLDNRYGSVAHVATQRSAYVNALFSSYLRSTRHLYTVGLSYRYDDYDETLDDRAYDRTERAAGAYGEYTYDFTGGTGALYGASVIAGFRVDHHTVGGWQALPRLNVKVNPSQGLALRVSVGRAHRSAQVIAENIRYLPTSRTFAILEPLRLETGWNYGAAVTHNFTFAAARGAERSGQWSVDVYATDFDNVAVLDQERTVDFTTVANATGPARTVAALASVRADVLEGFELRLAYKVVDARLTYADGVEREVPYVPAWRGLAAANYELPSERWRLDANLQVVGPQRLPGEDAFAGLAVEPDEPLLFESPVFALANAQVTYVANDRLEVYGGAENLTDYRQERAIIGAANDDDFGAFDASRVYAPLMGTQPYVGLRYALAD